MSANLSPMSTPVLHESAALSDGDLAKAPEPGEWRRQLIGLILGIVAAAVVYWCTNLVALQGQPQR